MQMYAIVVYGTEKNGEDMVASTTWHSDGRTCIDTARSWCLLSSKYGKGNHEPSSNTDKIYKQTQMIMHGALRCQDKHQHRKPEAD